MDTGGYDIWDYNSQVVSMQRRKGAALHRGRNEGAPIQAVSLRASFRDGGLPELKRAATGFTGRKNMTRASKIIHTGATASVAFVWRF